METGLQRFGVSMDTALLEQFDRLITTKGYTNRSEAIRVRAKLSAPSPWFTTITSGRWPIASPTCSTIFTRT
jgi:hypothetical protein